MKLRDLASSRAGDKGHISNLSVVAYSKDNFDFLESYLTAERVRDYFLPMCSHPEFTVVRYELPQLNAFNFVLYHLLGKGVTQSLALDAHGKTLSGYLLSMELET